MTEKFLWDFMNHVFGKDWFKESLKKSENYLLLYVSYSFIQQWQLRRSLPRASHVVGITKLSDWVAV